jgi:hypothetical protein
VDARQRSKLPDEVRILGGVLTDLIWEGEAPAKPLSAQKMARREPRPPVYSRPRSVVDRTRLCEGRGPGPNPGEDIFEIFETHLTPEPDGRAAACKAACSGFDSHRRFFSGLLRWCRPVQRRKGLPRLARGLVDQVRVFRTWVLKRPSPTSVSSVDRAPDLRSGCRGFDSRTKHQALGC